VIPFPVLLAWREGRAGLRRVGVYGLSIGLGVAALVSIHSFRADVARALDEQSRVLLGADVRLESDRPLPDSVSVVVDSLATAGHPVARVVGAVSMVSAPSSGAVRLLQVRGVEGEWPFYGEPRTVPEGLWDRRAEGGGALVDPAVLTQLDIEVGDTLVVGRSLVRILGTVADLPTELGFQTAVGPRVWLDSEALAGAGLLGFGSLARYETYLQLPDGEAQGAVRERYRELFRETGVDFTTADGQARSMTRAVDDLGRFLGLVGLGALLLGGVGVASAINVFVRERLTEVAVLRCIGARQNGLFAAYLLQAAALGLGGSALGAVVGVAVQHVLPGALAGVLPVEVSPRISWLAVAGGIGVGVWVAVVFALLPLLGVRNVPPLRALRADVEGGAAPGRVARALALAALAASVLALAVLEAPEPAAGVAFAVALAVATGLLWGAGLGFIAGARRVFPRRAPYPVRQGFSNLFRPRNQTVGVTLALGFGVFVVATVLQVESNLGRMLRLDAAEGTPNLLLFDIQPDQRADVLALLPENARASAEVTPMVPARLTAINGVAASELRELEGPDRPEGWALRREYRHTWRDELTDAEELVAGEWWDDEPAGPEALVRISVEEDLARDLAVGLGDTLTWSVAGREIPSRITSLRRVDWDRFQTNFFVVFEPGGLEGAPATWVILARVDGEEARATFQRSLVGAHPNVSVLDITRVQEVIEGILGQVERAIGFLAAFAAVAGLFVLAGAVAASRHQRLREGALLKTLGARHRQLMTVLFTEFLSLGTLATLTGLALAVAASWFLVAQDFGIEFRLDVRSLVGVWIGVVLLTVVTGLAGSRGLLRRPPLPVLRELVG
jgi:putative ABC transport system permease protein